MTRESSLWTCFREALPSDCHAVRVENQVELGTPDVNLCMPEGERSSPSEQCTGCNDAFCAGCGYWQEPVKLSSWDGWIELKVQDPPKRKTTMFRCEHFTTEQRQWAVDRIRAGGKAYLLIQVNDEYLWLRGDVAAVWVGYCTFSELRIKCEWHGRSLSRLVEFLRG
jgi:hypothetical protein